MSLIEEALRQVQETSPTTRAPSAVASSSRPASALPSVSSRPMARTKSGIPAAVMASFALIGLLVAAWLAGAVWWQTRPSGSPATVSSSSSRPSLPRLNFSARSVSTSVPIAFVLNGIADQGGEKVAVVNNTIVQAGDLVDGARVLEVRSDSVWLRAKNQDVILKTNR